MRLTADNGTQFTSTRFIETLNRLGITQRRTAHHHPEGNNYIGRFHRSLKEAEYHNVQEARESIAGYGSTITTVRFAGQEIVPHEALLGFVAVIKNEAQTV